MQQAIMQVFIDMNIQVGGTLPVQSILSGTEAIRLATSNSGVAFEAALTALIDSGHLAPVRGGMSYRRLK